MSKNKTDLLLKIGFVALDVIIWAWIVWNIWYGIFYQLRQETSPTGQLERKNELILVEGSFLKAVIPPAIPKFPVLGSLYIVGYSQAELLTELWQCETGLKHEGIWGDNGRAYGGFQFWQSTWDRYCQGSRDNFDDQVKCAYYIIFKLNEGHIHWERCWEKMNLDKYF